MRRQLVIAAVVVGSVLIAGAGAAYAYYFSGLRSTPKPLTASTPGSATTASSMAAAATGDLTGNWTVTSNSLAGFRAKENFVGQSSEHEAVVRTSTVSGGFTIGSDSGGSYLVRSVAIKVGLAGLRSVDQVLGHDVTQRDGIIQRQLTVQRYPEATFTADAASVPSTVTTQGQSLSLPGTLTIHGVSRAVTAAISQAQVIGDKIEVKGSIPIDMTDYGVQPPQAPFVTSVDSALTIEFDIFLARA
jgi:polyisoprenoid-binding protein YceI